MRAKIAIWMACALAASGCSVATDFGRFVLADDAGAGGMDSGGVDAGGVDSGGVDSGGLDAGSELDAGTDVDAAVCVPAAEVCNGSDDDCDMMVDEGGAGCVLPHATATCTAAACTVVTCDMGFDDCTGGPADGCETDLRTTAHCGACGTVCTGTEICDTSGSTSHCAATCSATPCSGMRCIDTSSDPANCGACDNACSTFHATASCAGGSCVLACNGGWGNCDMMVTTGCEAPLDTPMNCGACGNACPGRPFATASCPAMSCMWTCMAGHLDCDGAPGNGCEATAMTYYVDSDGDGWGSTPVTGCPMAGWVTRSGDCNDGNAAVSPSAREACGNGVDDNCNTTTDEGCAPNDTCGGAIDVPFNGTGRILGNFGMVAPGLDGVSCSGSGGATERDAYFVVAVPEPGAIIYLDTFGSVADTVLADEGGCPAATSSCMSGACGLSAGRIFLQVGPVPAGTGIRRRYFSVRLPAGHTPGAFRLNYEILPYPLARFEAITSGVGVATLDGTTGVMSTASAYPFCFVPSGPEDIFYWTQCPSAGRAVRIENASASCPLPWNQSLELLGPYNDTTGSLLMCSSGACPMLTTAAPDPGLYVIAVDGTSATPRAGGYRVIVTISPPLP